MYTVESLSRPPYSLHYVDTQRTGLNRLHYLCGCSSVPSCSYSDTTGRHQYVFTCVTIEGKDYCIQAATRDEMFVWIKVISEAMVRITVAVLLLFSVIYITADN